MAIVTTDDKHYKAIAEVMRAYHRDSSATYKPSEMADAVLDLCYFREDLGYADGIELGKAQGVEEGKQAEYDRFWDEFQSKGRTASYIYAFAGVRWNDQTYNPKYPIVANAAGGMFYYSEITDTKVDIDITRAGGASSSSLFQNAKKLKTIRLLKVVPETSFASGFTNCNSLEHITIDGVIESNLDMHWSPLTADSIRNILGALSTTATGKTVTFKQTAKEAAFTDEEWADLIGQRPNWTVVLA